MDTKPKKLLGQHWLHDTVTLTAIANFAELKPGDTVLEIGPGLGTLTTVLAERVQKVIAIEYDKELATKLAQRANLEVIEADIRKLDLDGLPQNYVVVANIPYYLTGDILRLLTEADNSPATMTLLVQKEVAERWAAVPGQMSLSAVAAQLFGVVTLGPVVPAALFKPPPKVDSQIVRIVRHQQPLFPKVDLTTFWQMAKAGFSARRKQLRSSLSGGLHLPKEEVEKLLTSANISPTARAQELSLEEWHRLSVCYDELVAKHHRQANYY